MDALTSHDVTMLFLSLGVLLGVARVLGELASRWSQPAVLGEMLAGVLLGPTVLGRLAPEWGALLFPAQGPNAIAVSAIAVVALALFLLVAGLEVDLSIVWSQGKTGLKVALASMALPFSIGLAAAWLTPDAFGWRQESDPLVFALFFATALAISALPVIAKTLMDLGLYRSELGMVIVSSAIFNDLVGWIIFSLILGLMGDASGHARSVWLTISLTVLFAAAMLTLGRRLVHAGLPVLQANTRWPGGELSFAVILALLGAAFTEWIGVHAVFGAFLVGLAIGDSSHLRERTRVTIDHFVASIFAPLFFASIGLRVDFVAYFDPRLTLAVLLLACVCKLAGGALGARWGGMPPREAWAVGFAMNSRGAMEIILGLLALEAGVIHQELLVALVIMAIATSMMSGPAMRLLLRKSDRRQLEEALSPRLFLPSLQAESRLGVIQEMTAAACSLQGLDAAEIESLVWAREQALSTGIGSGVALPHARVPDLRHPMVVVGRSDKGVDFDAPDGVAARLIFLVLTPSRTPGAQLEIASQIAWLAREPILLDDMLQARDFDAFLAAVRRGPALP